MVANCILGKSHIRIHHVSFTDKLRQVTHTKKITNGVIKSVRFKGRPTL